MTLSAHDAILHIEHTLASDTIPEVGAMRILNDAGEFLVNMHNWRWLEGTERFLDLAKDTNYVWLPDNFRELIAIQTTDGLNAGIQMTTQQQLVALRSHAASGASGYHAVVVHAQRQIAASSQLVCDKDPVDGSSLVLNDGLNAAVTFTFRDDAGMASGANKESTTSRNVRLGPGVAGGGLFLDPENFVDKAIDASSAWDFDQDLVGVVNTDIAPDGTLTADRLISDAADAFTDNAKQDVTITPADNAPYTFSVHIKKETTDNARLFLYLIDINGGATILEQVYFDIDLADGSIYAFAGAVTGGPGYSQEDITVESVGDYWRISYTLIDYGGTSNTCRIRIYPQPQGDGQPIRTVVVWGAQLVNALGPAPAYGTTRGASISALTDAINGAPALYFTAADDDNTVPYPRVNLTYSIRGAQGNLGAEANWFTDTSVKFGAAHDMAGGIAVGPPRPRLDIWPTPTSDATAGIRVYYRSGWMSVVEDIQMLYLPGWMETLYLFLVRAFARSYEREGDGSVSVRLNDIKMGPLFTAAQQRDKEMTPDIGPLTNGAVGAMYNNPGPMWNFSSTAGPS